MTTMHGNPHYDDAATNRAQLANEDTANEEYLAEAGINDATMQFSALNRNAEATLALAYEQRTATLVQFLDHLCRLKAQEASEINDIVLKRLGLRDE